MSNNVLIDIDPSVMRFFSDHHCMVGLDYIYALCAMYRYNMMQNCLDGTVNSYYNNVLKTPCIHVDFHEVMDMHLRRQTKDLIETFVYISIPSLDKALDLDCMREKNLSIPLIYSFYGEILY